MLKVSGMNILFALSDPLISSIREQKKNINELTNEEKLLLIFFGKENSSN
jgi:hypothetical protein